MQHTVNIVAAPIITVFDDRGEIVQTIMLPVCLLFSLPAALYLRLSSSLAALGSSLSALYQLFFGPGWRDDLYLMALALRLLFPLKFSPSPTWGGGRGGGAKRDGHHG